METVLTFAAYASGVFWVEPDLSLHVTEISGGSFKTQISFDSIRFLVTTCLSLIQNVVCWEGYLDLNLVWGLTNISGIFGYINYLVERDRKYIIDTLLNGTCPAPL